MDCKHCGHYELYKMVTSGKPFGYSGDIPCTHCSRFSFIRDEYTPAVNQSGLAGILQQAKECHTEVKVEG